MLKLVFLTDQFYNAYKNCPEIEQKETRPFIRIEIFLDGVLWAIPLRSNIAHQHVIWTDRENGCGADLTKAVVIEDPEKYISDIKPYVRPNEFKVLKKIDAYYVSARMRTFISDYKKAKAEPFIPRNKFLLKYSTLQYFEDYI